MVRWHTLDCVIRIPPRRGAESHRDVGHHQQLESGRRTARESRSRAALVGAEIARIEGRDLDAERLYEQAIRSAREHGFVQNEGLAYESGGAIPGGAWLRGGTRTSTLRHARHCYRRWGADGKVRQLDELYPPPPDKTTRHPTRAPRSARRSSSWSSRPC